MRSKMRGQFSCGWHFQLTHIRMLIKSQMEVCLHTGCSVYFHPSPFTSPSFLTFYSGSEARAECTQGTLYPRADCARLAVFSFEHRKTGKELESGAFLDLYLKVIPSVTCDRLSRSPGMGQCISHCTFRPSSDGLTSNVFLWNPVHNPSPAIRDVPSRSVLYCLPYTVLPCA